MGKKKTENPKRSNQKGKLISFLTDERFKITLALLLTGIGILMLIAFVSYFFTWKFDQNVEWSSKVREVENWAGKMGALIAKGVIYKGFGIAAFFIPFVLIVLGFRLLKVKLVPLGRTLAISVAGMPLLSIILGYLFEKKTNTGFIGSGLGGYHGHEMVAWLKIQLGSIGTGILLILLTFLFLTFFFKGFFGWFIKTLKSVKM